MSNPCRVIEVLPSGEYGRVGILRLPNGAGLIVVKAMRVDALAQEDSELTNLRRLRGGIVPNTTYALGGMLCDQVPEELVDTLIPKKECVLAKNERMLLIFMPLEQGVTLYEYLDARAVLCRELELAESVGILRQLTEFCFRAYHEYGMCHNDLKCGNVMFAPRNSEIKVIDFTFSRLVSEKHTAMTWGRGSPPYMAPEKIFLMTPPEKWKDVDVASADLWSLGIIFATAVLTGRRIFPRGTPIMTHYHSQSRDSVFRPSKTNTFFELLPETEWFTRVSRDICEEAKESNRLIVNHAIRLLLWTRALVTPPGEKPDPDFGFPGNNVIPGIESSALFKAVDRRTAHILDLYDRNGPKVYEHAVETLREALGGELFGLFCVLQAWDVTSRRGGTDMTVNPFLFLRGNLAPKFFHQGIPKEQAIRHTIGFKDDELGWFSGCDKMGLSVFLGTLADDDTSVCCCMNCASLPYHTEQRCRECGVVMCQLCEHRGHACSRIRYAHPASRIAEILWKRSK